MLRNYISAALGDLSRNWLYTAVTVFGLAVSFAAAMLIGLYLRDELSFDRFIPDHQRVYRMESTIALPGAKPVTGDAVQPTAAANLAMDFPGVERTARMQVSDVSLTQGDAESVESLAWVDPSFFKIMRLPVLAGDPNAALEAPDGLVLTRAMARRFFGKDAPIGMTLKVSMTSPPQIAGTDETRAFATPQVMRVLAVLRDLPSSSHMTAGVFGSSRAALSTIALDDRHPSPFVVDTLVYVKLKPGASIDAIRAGMGAFGGRHYPGPNGGASIFKIGLVPLTALHFGVHQSLAGFRPPGNRAVDAGIGTVGLLIIVIAAINFVTLMTARATRRSVEVGVRKAVGARRSDLIAQFVGEALIYVLASMLIGLSLAELSLPYVNAFIGRDIHFDYLTNPGLAATIVGAVALITLLVGAYPALVLSRFRPALALKGAVGQSTGSSAIRQMLVVVQFAILIGLIVMTATIYRQTTFALNQALRLDADQVLRIGAPCESALKQQIANLPSVRGVACVSGFVLDGGAEGVKANAPGHTPVNVNLGPADVGFFGVQGLKPLSGRFFDPSKGQDVILRNPAAAAGHLPNVVLNETAVLRLGFKNPRDAVGRTLQWGRFTIGRTGFPAYDGGQSQVIGVVRDFTLRSIRDRIEPTLYYVDPSATGFMVVRLSGRDIPQTLRAINRTWQSTGHDRALPAAFESQIVQDLYKDVITQEVVIGICAGLAIVIACLGLFALSAFITERRTKEIGVRKAMGAGRLDILKLLLWQFIKPVLWANLFAWPVAFWVMNHWLDSFAYRVSLPPWLFAAASVAAALIAWATVAAHAWIAARAEPAAALRYE